MNSIPNFLILLFSHGVQSLETTLPIFSTFSNYKKGVEWYYMEETPLGP